MSTRISETQVLINWALTSLIVLALVGVGALWYAVSSLGHESQSIQELRIIQMATHMQALEDLGVQPTFLGAP